MGLRIKSRSLAALRPMATLMMMFALVAQPMYGYVAAQVANAAVAQYSVSDELELRDGLAAAQDGDFIILSNDISISEPIVVSQSGVNIYGQGHAISYSTGANANGWGSEYVLHVYRASNVNIRNITLTGGDAGLLVNGSQVSLSTDPGFTGVDVSGNEFGGIEVSRGGGVTEAPKLSLHSSLSLINSNETAAKPTIWTDGYTGSDWVVDSRAAGSLGGTINPLKNTQRFYYLNSALVPAPELSGLGVRYSTGEDKDVNPSTPFAGVYVEFKLKHSSELTNLKMIVHRDDDTEYYIEGTPKTLAAFNAPEAQMTGVSRGGTIIVTGENSSSSWTNQDGTWTGSSRPRTNDPVEVRMTFADGTTKSVFSGIGAPENKEAVFATVPAITSVDAYYSKETSYTAIGVDFSAKNITDATGVELRVNREDGSTYSIYGTSDLVTYINTVKSFGLSAPIVVTGSRTSGAWTPQDGTWSGTALPVSVDVIITRDSNQPPLIFNDDTIGTTLATWGQVKPADVVSPSVPVLSSPVNRGYSKTNDFYFDWADSTDDNTVTYEFQSSQNPHTAGGVLDTGVWKSGVLADSTIHSTGASDGDWYWQVRAIDAAGNKSNWSSVWKMTIDSGLPTTTLVTPTGLAGNVFTVSGVAKDNLSLNRVHVQLVNRENSQRYGGTTIGLSGTEKNWSREFDATDLNLPEGTYAAHVAVVDNAGNTTSQGWSANFTLDKTKPTVTATMLNTDITVGGTTEVTISATDVPSGIEYVQYRILDASKSNIPGLGWIQISNDVATDASDISGLAPGSYILRARAFDNAGNKKSGADVAFTVSEAAVAPVIIGDIAVTDNGNGTSTVSGTATPGSVIRMLFRSNWIEGIEVDTNGTWFGRLNNPTTPGSYPIEVSVRNYDFPWSEPIIATLTVPAGSTGDTNRADEGIPAAISGTNISGPSVPGATTPLLVAALTAPTFAVSGPVVDDDAAVLGTTDTAAPAATANDEADAGDADESNGLAWYWWLIIAIAGIGAAWWIIAALRRKIGEDE